MLKLRLLVLLALAANATGCAELARDRRDAPWDPRPGQQLSDQIPAWEGAANQLCGGHLTESERRREGRSPRC